MMGADYFMYGIKQLEIVPSMAMVDSVIAYTQRQQKIRSTLKVTPLSQLMKQE
jgi:tetrahydromethanopterin S-methyltransferase subunit H